MGQVADSIYVQYVNQERHQEKLTPGPVALKLPNELPTKWALLQVLSKNCWISASAAKVLLFYLGYERSLSAIRRALTRCLRFGLVEKMNYFTNETGVLRGKKPRRHSKWKMTERGRQLANADPAKVLKGKKKEAYVYLQQANTSKGSDGSTEVRVHPEQRKVLGP